MNYAQDLKIGDFAKVLASEGVEIGQNKLFQWLRDNGYLVKNGLDRNMPHQQFINKGYFRVSFGDYTVKHSLGEFQKQHATTYVTHIGQIALAPKIRAAFPANKQRMGAYAEG